MGVVNAIPSRGSLCYERKCFCSYFLSVKGEMVDILDIRSKNVYKEFCSYKSTPPSAQAKWEDKYPSFWGKW